MYFYFCALFVFLSYLSVFFVQLFCPIQVSSPRAVYNAYVVSCRWRASEPAEESDYENPVTGYSSGHCEWSGVRLMTRESLKSHHQNAVTGYKCEWTVRVECSVMRVMIRGLASSTRPPPRP